MPLYLVDITSGADYDYDEYDGFVVRAASEHHARTIASEGSPESQRRIWFDETKVTVEEVQPGGEAGVILSSFNAG